VLGTVTVAVVLAALIPPAALGWFLVVAAGLALAAALLGRA
jgi:hypothetical protein